MFKIRFANQLVTPWLQSISRSIMEFNTGLNVIPQYYVRKFSGFAYL